MKIAALQMVSSARPEENLNVARSLLVKARDAGAELALLPEYFSTMGLHEHDKLAHAETFGTGMAQDFLARSAQDLGLWVVGGSVPLRSADSQRVRNSSLVYSPQGLCAARYDKLHLFRYQDGTRSLDESRTMVPGNALVAAQTDLGRVGLTICYDLRFPELVRAMGPVDLLLVPSAFTETTGRAHWEVLLRARAIENQCYVLAAAQGGVHTNGRQTHGHSMLVDPWGDVVACLPSGPGLVMGEMDLERLASVRKAIPTHQHQRLVSALPSS